MFSDLPHRHTDSEPRAATCESGSQLGRSIRSTASVPKADPGACLPSGATSAGRRFRMTGENGPTMDGWALPQRYHCGQWCERDCPICGEDAVQHPHTPPNCDLGEN